MRKTVVGTFDSGEEAEQVAVLLIEHGFDRSDIAVRATGATTGTTTSPPESTSWWDWLFGESEDRSYYSERMNRGGAILAVTTDEEGAERARRLMEAEGGDVEPSEQSDAAPTRTARQASAPRATAAGQPGPEEVLPVVEERLRTGKRPVASGAVRVYSRVTERPVEEWVPLREEHVRVERRPADRPIGDPAAAFREDVIEVEETAEEVVVAKEAPLRARMPTSAGTGRRRAGRGACHTSNPAQPTGSAMSSPVMAATTVATGRRSSRRRAGAGRSGARDLGTGRGLHPVRVGAGARRSSPGRVAAALPVPPWFSSTYRRRPSSRSRL